MISLFTTKITKNTKLKEKSLRVLRELRGDKQNIAVVLGNGRDERIRTSDPSVPNAVLYQTEPHPDL